MKKPRVSNATYPIGRGKPPKKTQFRPGQSGNPRGRPKGVRNFKTDVRATLKSPVKVTRDGKPERLSTQEAMLLRLREKALAGDPRALDRLIELARVYDEDGLGPETTLSADDDVLLEIYKARVLSGAVDTPDAATDG